jgi:hypothetical protein
MLVLVDHKTGRKVSISDQGRIEITDHRNNILRTDWFDNRTQAENEMKARGFEQQED